MVFRAVAQEECGSDSRWNCPCAGGTRREHRSYKRSQTLVNTASQARRMTEDLLRKLVGQDDILIRYRKCCIVVDDEHLTSKAK